MCVQRLEDPNPRWVSAVTLYEYSSALAPESPFRSGPDDGPDLLPDGFQHAVALATLAHRWGQYEDLNSLLGCIVGEGRELLRADGVAVLRLQAGRWFTVAASDTVTRRAADVHASFKGLARTRANRERADADVEEFNVARRTRRHLRSEGSGRLQLLSLPLTHPAGTWGALNVYANEAGATLSEHLGPLYAQHASVALTHIAEREALRQGVAAQRRIGQAQGILMNKQGLSADVAYESLVRLSKRANVKLHVAAEHVISAHQPAAPRLEPAGIPTPAAQGG